MKVWRHFSCIIIGFLNLCFCSNSFAIQILEGDGAALAGQTFSFPVGIHVVSSKGVDFYLGSLTAGAKEFALAGLRQGADSFSALAPEKVRLDGVEDQNNPLYNAKIAFLTLLQETANFYNTVDHLVVVKDGQTTIYLNLQREMLSVQNVKDASGNDMASAINALTTNNGLIVFAAVSGNGVNFGDPNSGIAVFAFGSEKKEVDGKEVIEKFFRQFDVVANPPANTGQTRATPVNKGLNSVKIGNNLTAMESTVDLYWNPHVKRLYVALEVTAGSAASDGAKALLVGHFENDELVLESAAPDSVFDGALNKIIGGVGAEEQISLHKVRSMRTSTRLNYAIILGGNGAPGDTKRSVFALPLTHDGFIADKDNFDEAAVTSGQMTTSADAASSVGGEDLPAGDITDIFVRSDAVFVTVGEPDINQLPGTFYSQALFDAQGKIKNWTRWRRAQSSFDPTGRIEKVFGGGLDPGTANLIIMTGNNAGDVKTIKRTVWANGDPNGLNNLVTQLEQEFPKNSCGIDRLFYFPFLTPGLHNSSLLIAAGSCKIVLIQAAEIDSNNVLIPTAQNFATDKQVFDDGTVTQDQPNGLLPVIVSIAGGELDAIGPITSAAIAQNGTNGFLYVGGSKGLAVLSEGWNLVEGLGPHFSGLRAGMAFERVGAYSFIRKLVADGTNLYVLTDLNLDRINLVTNTISTIATLTDLPGHINGDTLLDVIVSGKFALLATSRGLVRVGNGSDISTATIPADVGWVPVAIPETVGPIMQLVANTVTGRDQDVAAYGGGNIYALNAYIGKDLGQIVRYSVRDVSSSAIDDATIMPLQYSFILGIPPSFVNFSSYRDQITYDGAFLLSSRDRDLTHEPFVQLLSAKAESGAMFARDLLVNLPLNLGGSSDLTKIIRNAATGSWLIGGNFNGRLRVNE